MACWIARQICANIIKFNFNLVNNKDPLVRLVRRAQASVGRWSQCQDGQEGGKGGVCRHG